MKSEKIKTIGSYIFPIARSSFLTIILFMMAHSAFWGIEQAHTKWCAPPGMKGYLFSIFTNQSSLCSTLRQLSRMASDASANAFYIITCFFAGIVYSKKK